MSRPRSTVEQWERDHPNADQWRRDERRGLAMTSARMIRAAVTDRAAAGERTIAHVDMSRPRRGVWLATWANLPGLILDLGRRTYTHALLPGWQYAVTEMKTEMIEDLERFAATGELPKKATARDD